jgi:thioesterase domain-containing protein
VNTSLGGHLTPNDLMRATTPAALARLVTGRLAERDVTPLLLNAEGDREPVHFVCGAGGPAVQYRSLAKALGRDQPVAVYEQTGLHRRWRRDRSVSGAASRHIAQIERLSPSGGVVVAGHSYGGVVANEMARRLAARGRAVRLVMIDPVDMGMVDGRLHRPVNLRVRSGSRAVHFLKLCWWRLHRLRRVLMLPGAPGSIRRYETFYQAGGRQVRQHRVIPFDGPTLLIRAGQGDPPLRWSTTLHMEVVTVSADHNGVVLPPAVDRTADAISRWLEPPEVAALSVSSRPTLSR